MGGLKLAHHFMIFVIQDVAVIGELARVILETHDDAYFAEPWHLYGVFPGIDFRWLQRNWLTGEPVDLVQHLELYQVNVHGMHHIGVIFELPYLGIPKHRIFGNVIPLSTDDSTVRTVQRLDHPLPRCTGIGTAGQPKMPCTRGLCLRNGSHCPQCSWQRPGKTTVRQHDEFHDIGKQWHSTVIVTQDDLRSRSKAGKIDDHVKTLRRRHAEVVKRQWRIDQAAVGPDQVEGDQLPGVRRILQPHVVDPGRRAIQHAEAVFALFDIEIRPHLAIDQHLVAVEMILQSRRVIQRAVRIELTVLDHQGNLEFTGRQTQAGLETVTQEVKPGQAHVDIQARDPQCMIVVPQGGRGLVIRILVGIEGARQEIVFRLTVKPRRHMPTVQMRHGPRRATPVVRPMRTGIDVQVMRTGRQVVDVFYLDRLYGRGLDRGTGKAAGIGPDIR